MSDQKIYLSNTRQVDFFPKPGATDVECLSDFVAVVGEIASAMFWTDIV